MDALVLQESYAFLSLFLIFKVQVHLMGIICATAHQRCKMQCGFTVNTEDLCFKASSKLNSLFMQTTDLPF